MAQKARAIIINENDNVATALERIDAGEVISVKHRGQTAQINLPSTIPAGHKFALCEIGAGEYVVKYGEPIGQAVVRIRPGEHVHVHNIKSHGKNSKGELV
jgi:altronate dehydratase small subunit